MCDEYGSLLSEYQKAVSRFSTTLVALEAGRRTVGRAEYARMLGYVDQARLYSERARINLEKHTAEHGCLSEAASNAT
jgi:hypothetical protein